MFVNREMVMASGGSLHAYPKARVGNCCVCYFQFLYAMLFGCVFLFIFLVVLHQLHML